MDKHIQSEVDEAMGSTVWDLWWRDKGSTCCGAALNGASLMDTSLFISPMTRLPCVHKSLLVFIIININVFFSITDTSFVGILMHCYSYLL